MSRNRKKDNVFDLNTFISEITHLQEAKELIERVFVEVGPYGNGKISEELLSKINDYMKFDDSE
ncbi:hypothetical protein D3C87_77650 [compost metagenome]